MSSVAIAAACVALPVYSQVLGDLKGRVADASGATVAGATVQLTDMNTGVRQNATTSSAGTYDFPNLVSSVYVVRVKADGFNFYERSGVTVTTGQTVGLDFVLPVGDLREVVQVSADAPPLQTGTSDIQTTIPGRTVVALPLNSRNFIQLAQLAPGVELPSGTLLPRINGGRPRTNEYLYDGISALQPEPGQVAFFPIVDDIAEFTILANNVPAEFGRFNGGVVNVATRSGSNTIHGSVYEFFRNEDLNTRNYFARSGAKPEYRRNLYGATIGGPVVHDKLFLFADYQGIKQRIGVTRISTVPTPAQRAGNFGTTNIYDPNTTTTVNAERCAHDLRTTPSTVRSTQLRKRCLHASLFPTFPAPRTITHAQPATTITRTSSTFVWMGRAASVTAPLRATAITAKWSSHRRHFLTVPV